MGIYLPTIGSALPLPDPFEPNDSEFAAASITEGTYTGLTLSASDTTDWYIISVPAEMAIYVEIEITAGSDEDYFYLNLEGDTYYLHDSDGFSYYVSPSEYDDVIGNAALYCEEANEILIHFYPSYYNDPDATYTMMVDVFDPIGTPKFEYGINVDDELIYTLSNTVDFEASDNFYTVIQNYTESEVTAEDYYYVVAPDFSLQNFVEDMDDFISTTIDLKLDITDIYNFDLLEDYSMDMIIGDVRMGNDGTWELPSDYLVAKMEEFKTVIQPHMNTTTYNDMAEPGIDDAISEIETATTADFNDLTLSNHAWFEDVSAFIGFDGIPVSNVTGNVLPTYPFDHYLPIGGMLMPMGFMTSSMIFSAFSSASICYPTDFDIGEIYQYGRDMYGYLSVLADEMDEDIPALAYTIDELIAIGGISTFVVNSQSVGISWSLNGIDFLALDAIMEYTEGNLENDFADQLAQMGIDYDNSAAGVSMALEYDADMVLASVAYYINMELAIDETELPTELADLGGEMVNITFSQSFVREGYVPPTEQQIQNGDVGEDRSLSGGFDWSSIPGYSGMLVALLSIASTFVLISRKKHNN